MLWMKWMNCGNNALLGGKQKRMGIQTNSLPPFWKGPVFPCRHLVTLCQSKHREALSPASAPRLAEQSGLFILYFLSCLFFAVFHQSFQFAFLLSQECGCCHSYIYWQCNLLEIKLGIGLFPTLLLFFLITDS